MTRTLVNASCTVEFRRSILVCMISNRGNPTRMTHTMAMASNGTTTRKITASFALIRNAIMIAPISMPGARSIILSAIISTFCTWVISFVRRVTSEPVLNWSMLENENCCTFLNTSLLRSAAKLIDALAANQAPPTPPAIMMSAVITMVIPFPII